MTTRRRFMQAVAALVTVVVPTRARGQQLVWLPSAQVQKDVKRFVHDLRKATSKMFRGGDDHGDN